MDNAPIIGKHTSLGIATVRARSDILAHWIYQLWWIVLHTWRGLGLLASKLPRRGPHKATDQVFLSRTCSEGWGGAAGSLVWGARCWWPRCSPPKMLSPRGPGTCPRSNGSSASSAERGLPSCFSRPCQGHSACPRGAASSSHGRPCFPKDTNLPQESSEHSLSEASDEAQSLKQTHRMLFFIATDDNSWKEKNTTWVMFLQWLQGFGWPRTLRRGGPCALVPMNTCLAPAQS